MKKGTRFYVIEHNPHNDDAFLSAHYDIDEMADECADKKVFVCVVEEVKKLKIEKTLK